MSPPLGLRAAVIGSSGGAALAAADACWRSAGHTADWLVLTDRRCGLLDWAAAQGHANALLPYDTAEAFSALALERLRAFEVDDALLFYTRRVAAPLIEAARVCNLHPAALPDFKGLGAVAQAMRAGASVLGTTLHEVDAGLDTGPVLAQLKIDWQPSWTLAEAEHQSFRMKVWLTLWWCERLALGPQAAGTPPALRDGRVVRAHAAWLDGVRAPTAAMA